MPGVIVTKRDLLPFLWMFTDAVCLARGSPIQVKLLRFLIHCFPFRFIFARLPFLLTIRLSIRDITSLCIIVPKHTLHNLFIFFFFSLFGNIRFHFSPPKMNEGNVSRVNSSSLRDRERERRLFSQSKYKRSIMDEKKEKEKNDDRRKDTYVVIMSSSGIINAHVITLRLIRGFKLQVNALV